VIEAAQPLAKHTTEEVQTMVTLLGDLIRVSWATVAEPGDPYNVDENGLSIGGLGNGSAAASGLDGALFPLRERGRERVELRCGGWSPHRSPPDCRGAVCVSSASVGNHD
jgi:hypothetical protein